MRLRIQLTGWDRRTLTLTDTPRPDCRRCDGYGGFEHDYGDHDGEYAGTDWEPCICWDETRRWALFRLPSFPRRHQPTPGPWGNEPPF